MLPGGQRVNGSHEVVQHAPVGGQVWVYVKDHKDGGKFELSMARVNQQTGARPRLSDARRGLGDWRPTRAEDSETPPRRAPRSHIGELLPEDAPAPPAMPSHGMIDPRGPASDLSDREHPALSSIGRGTLKTTL